MTFKKIIIAAVIVVTCASLLADFTSDFQTAMKLYKEKEYQNSEAAFSKLAEISPTTKAKDECLLYAAYSLGYLQQYDKAILMAKRIENRPLSMNCQMDVMLENKKYNELVEAFKREDIGSWPENCVDEGFYRRGTAYRLTGDARSAAKDIERAITESGTDYRFQALALTDLGGILVMLKEYDKALDAYLKVLTLDKFKGDYFYYTAAIGAAGILSLQGRYDEAFEKLGKAGIPASGDWRLRMLETYGDLYMGMGRKDEAELKYGEAMNVKGAQKALHENLKKKLDIKKQGE